MTDRGAGPGRLTTVWGEQVNPDTAWPEYPRPHLVRDAWLNLNGLWEYAIRPRTAPRPADWDGDILVPYPVESALSGVRRAVSPSDTLWYRRPFTIPLAWRGQRIVLHFGAVDYECAVWINDAFVTAHRGGFDPFSIDITEFVRDENVVVAGVWDPSNRDEQPRGKQHLKPQEIWYTAVTGIWQTVWLEPLPLNNHIEELRITPDLAAATIDVEALLGRPTTQSDLAVRLTVVEAGRTIATVLAPPDRRVRVAIPRPRRWSPDTPFLYDVVAELVAVENAPAVEQPRRGADETARYAAAQPRGDVIDRVASYFGMRSIVVRTDPHTGRPTLLLNGEPVFHLGTLDQGWWPDGLLTPPADAAIEYELQFLKAAGFNALRKHVKVEPARYYYHCDHIGILVWQDMPSGFAPAQYVAPNDVGEGLRKAVVTEQYELELRRMLNRLHPHPCIVMWVIHNEGWGQFDTRRLADWVKALDPSRLVNAASGWLDIDAGDVRDTHDYAQAPGAPQPDARRVSVLGEFGGIGWPIAGHLWNPDARNWGYQTYHTLADVEAAYRQKIAAVIAMHRQNNAMGAIYTQTTDVEGEVNGLLTYDRRVEKLSRQWLRAVHAGVGHRVPGTG
jgi:beta-galactosidase/beta-glucuronidase